MKQISIILLCVIFINSKAENPFIKHIFTADPSAHVFEGKIYVYPSHDKDDAVWYNMSDYHVFSSEDLVKWTDHGKVLDVKDVTWAKEYMWAPDCVFKNGTYYFYFPAKDTNGEFKIGVATSQKPYGPFIPEHTPIKGSFSVDPAVFIDDDGSAYMYFGGDGHGKSPMPYVAKLKENMKEFAETPRIIDGATYWFEACWMHKYKGKYYLSYSTGKKMPNAVKSSICYAIANNPYGPFIYQGVLNEPTSSWTNHQSTVEFKGQWYFFYHNSDISNINEKRSIAVDFMYYNEDGTIKKIIQTKEGVKAF